MELPPKGYKRNLVISAYVILISVGVYIFFKYLLSPLLPFIFAYITALFLRPSIDKICKRTKLPRKAVAFVAVSFVFVLVFSVIGIFFGRMLSELKSLSDSLMDGGAGFIEDIFGAAEEMTQRLPIIKDIENKETAEQIRHAVVSMLEGALTSFSSKLPEAVMGIVSSLPGILLFAITLIVATFYLGADIGSVNALITRLVPKEHHHRLFSAKEKLMKAGGKYLRAYAIILIITFIQLFIGFALLRIPYALTLAALIAVIDILPVLGVGTVLVPWAIILFIMGDSFTGAGLLIVFAVIWLVRQVSEPKIVGQSLGIPPLLTLAAMYIGFKLIGFGGLFLFPIAAIIVKCLIDANVIGSKK